MTNSVAGRSRTARVQAVWAALFALGSLALASAWLAGCGQPTANRVVLYCSVDEVFARPIIARLEKQTGLQIEPLFDVEAAKTAGLANKLRAESNRPRADVFWSSALLQTLLLGREGLLAPYRSPSAKDIPQQFRDPEGLWTGIGLRARVLVSHRPRHATTLAAIPLPGTGQFAISNPQFGTSSDWAAAYTSSWGPQKTLQYFQALKAGNTHIMPGNADVALSVAEGHLAMGITDSDDFLNQKLQKKSIYLVPTDQDNVLVPGTAALIAGAPHTANGQKLLDALLARETEQSFIKVMPGVFSVRNSLKTAHNGAQASWASGGTDFSYLSRDKAPNYSNWAASWEAIRTPLATVLSP